MPCSYSVVQSFSEARQLQRVVDSHTCLTDHTQQDDTLYAEYYGFNCVFNCETEIRQIFTYLNPVSKQVMNVNNTIIRISIQYHYQY